MDSLVIAGLELIGTATNPEYRLANGLDFGAPEPDTATIKSLLLDGDVVRGRRTGNRTFNLSVRVFASGASTGAVRSALTAFGDTLLAAVAAETFTLQWTPDGGLPVVWDCFRARGQRVRSIVGDDQGATLVTLSFQAAPFGRSTTDQTIAAAITSTQIDSFDTAPTGAALSTTIKYEGTGSARYTGSNISRSFSAKDLSAFSNVLLWAYSAESGSGTANIQVGGTLTLTSASGSTRYNITGSARGSVNISKNRWYAINTPLSGGTTTAGTGVTLSAVTGYTLAVTVTSSPFGTVTSTGPYFDDLRALGSSSALASSTHGAVLTLPSIVGSARAPGNFTVTNGSTLSGVLLHSPPDSQDGNLGILQALSTGSNNQTVTVAALNAMFAGTYSVVLGVGSPGSGSTTVAVTVTQLENGAAVGSPQVLNVTYTAGAATLIPAGEVTLPLYAVPDDNTLTSFTIQVNITAGTERFSELMLLDTQGQTVFSDVNLAAAAAAVYVDEPTPLQSGSMVYATTSATNLRGQAYSVMGRIIATGGPMMLDPGANKILAWVDVATPIVTAAYSPRWQDERVS